MQSSLSYQQVQDALGRSSCEISAAEAHGVMTGMLCISAKAEGSQILAALFDAQQPDVTSSHALLLLNLYEQTRQALTDDGFSFTPFLPDDEVELDERAAALAEWCQGFLYGVGYQSASGDWPGESFEVLSDLAEISRLDADASGEADETAFVEISEFVRIAVQMIHGEFRQQEIATRLH